MQIQMQRSVDETRDGDLAQKHSDTHKPARSIGAPSSDGVAGGAPADDQSTNQPSTNQPINLNRPNEQYT